MAPPNFPNGISLHDIGFAALKYPALPPEPYNVPLGNIVGALQHADPASSDHMIAQIASQYLNALLDYQVSGDASLNDPSLPQYYFSTAICLLNFLNTNPDVCKRIAAKPGLVNGIIEKMLAADFETRMKAVERPSGAHFPAATFEDDLGSLVQFLSTVFIWKDEMVPLPPRMNELVPILKTWKRTYKHSRVKTISAASDRLANQIRGDASMVSMVPMMKEMQESSLVCGVAPCSVQGAQGLTLCNGCRIQRYCGRPHQKADWKYHKHICNKGLQDPVQE